MFKCVRSECNLEILHGEVVHIHANKPKTKRRGTLKVGIVTFWMQERAAIVLLLLTSRRLSLE